MKNCVYLDIELNSDDRVRTLTNELYEYGYYAEIKQFTDILGKITTSLVITKNENGELFAVKPLVNAKWTNDINKKQYELIVCNIEKDLQYLIDYPIDYPKFKFYLA